MKTRTGIICILLAILMLAAGLLPASSSAKESAAAAATVCRSIRVKISTAEKSSVTFTVVGTYYLSESPSFVISAGSCTIAVSGSSLKITSGGKSLVVGPTITLVRATSAYTNGSYLRIPNTRYDTNINYLGDMIFSRNSSTSVRVINEVNIEEYLYGLVPYEMSNSFPIESLKAQAVCARGYAVAAVLKSPSAAYHLVDTSAAQVYRGYNASYQNAIDAVNATAGMVLTYGGKIITAYYAASNGGQTELSGNAWSTNLPYYVHKDDPYDLANPSSSEELTFVPAEYTDANKALMNAELLKLIQNMANDEAGKSVTLLQTLSVTPHTPDVNAKVNADDTVSRCFTKADIELSVLRSGDEEPITITITVFLDDLLAQNDDDDDAPFQKTSLRMRGAEVSAVEGQVGWQLTNRRYGHGVGLSQRGAQQRARDGQLYDEILAFYYDGTTLTYIDTEPVVQPDQPAAHVYPGKVVGVSSSVSVRIGPGTSYESFATIPLDGLVLVTYPDYVSGWYQVVYNGNLGYVQSQYITLLADTAYTTPGWLVLSDAVYYLDASGTPHKGVSTIDGKTYCFNSFGMMQTGLIFWQDNLYYAGSDGVLLSGTYTINGFELTFDETTFACPADACVSLISASYTLDRDNGRVTGVARETTVDAFFAGFYNPAGIMRVVDAAGRALDTDDFVGTGMRIQTVVGGEVRDSLVITVRGDVSGDGYVDIADVLTIQAHILESTPITDDSVFRMADLNGDSYADVNDILIIISDILGKADIEP